MRSGAGNDAHLHVGPLMITSPKLPRVLTLGLKMPKPLLVWCASLICIYFAFEAGLFLYTRHFHPLIAWVLFINIAIAISLLLLKKAALGFSLLKLVVSFGLFSYDYSVHGNAIYTTDYVNWLLINNEALLAAIAAGARTAFTVWLFFYAVHLYRKKLLN